MFRAKLMVAVAAALLFGLVFGLGSSFLIPAVASASDSDSSAVKAFVGATLYPVSGDAIPNATLVIKNKRIQKVGSADKVRIPRNAQVIDVQGKVIVPGLVDTHSHVGEVAGGDRSAPIQPETRVLDSINVRDAGFSVHSLAASLRQILCLVPDI